MKKFYISLATLCILSAVFGIWTLSRAGGEEISACVGPSGLMRWLASGECRRGETELNWNVQGPQGLQGERGPAGSQLHLFDASGQDLGVLLDIDNDIRENGTGFRTDFPSLDAVFDFQSSVNPPSFIVSSNLLPRGLVFSESDCSGMPFVVERPLHDYTVTEFDGSYYMTGGVDSDPGTAMSYFDNTGRVCMNILPEATSTFPLVKIVLPFTLPLAYPPMID
ncbi:MAG: hypothetical protein Q8R39_00975 [bacterium]|nr:hypothetical protein [bacterium]MDZ4285160.1 hypothetical protein [Patescibacteria group bacterium]